MSNRFLCLGLVLLARCTLLPRPVLFRRCLEAPRIHIDSQVLASLIKEKVANGSAPGPSGWTGELLALIGS